MNFSILSGGTTATSFSLKCFNKAASIFLVPHGANFATPFSVGTGGTCEVEEK